MAGLTRKTLIQFGSTGPSTSYGQFGSKEAGSPQTSQNPDVIQQLSAWVQGWQDAVVAGNKAPYLEDMNGWCFVHSYMMVYMFQMGISEYDSQTTYQLNSIVQDAVGGGQWFKSLQANNIGNTPPVSASNAFWRWMNPPQELVGTATLNVVPKVTTAVAGNGPAGSAVLGDSALSDDGVNVITTLPIKFPDLTVQSTAAVNSAVSIQTDVTSTRALDTVFHNSGTKPLFIAASIFNGLGASGTTAYVQALSDANVTPVLVVAQAGDFQDVNRYMLFFIVLPGNYYKIQKFNINITLLTWIEWS